MEVSRWLLTLALVGGSMAGGASLAADIVPDVNASTVTLPCIPIGTYWVGPVPSEGTGSAPDLAVVNVDVRPKSARVHLDERFAGRARYFDGSPGYLYLEPGSYRLELRLEGYRTVAVGLEAQRGCRFDLKHRMERIPGTAKERSGGEWGKGKPTVRLFEPVPPSRGGVAAGTQRDGPDPALRPDLEARGAGAAEAEPAAGLRIRVEPPTASVAIDGVFVATGTELSRMVGPLAVTAGHHTIEVTARGFEPVVREVVAPAGGELEVEVTLVEAASGHRE